MRILERLVLVLAVPMALVGCGGPDSAHPEPSEAGTVQQGPPPGIDAAPPSDGGGADTGDSNSGDGGVPGYPAFVPDIGRISNQGGTVLTSPKIVSVTWSTDTNASSLQDFGDKIGASSYWKAIAGEYGVGAATSGMANHVVITTPSPNPWDDQAIESWIIQQLTDTATSKWPSPDAQTVYIVYTPPGVKVTSSGQDACQTYSGYHSEVTVGSNAHVLYGLVVGECNGPDTVLNAATETSAHEIVEAATDPHTNSDLAYTQFDNAHWAWEMFQQNQDEVADACENYNESYYMEGADLPYYVQRSWSNASAIAGHDPCVPAVKAPYFNVTQLNPDAISVVVDPQATKPLATTGYHIPVGQTKTFSVGLYSDAPTAGAWTVKAVEGDGMSTPAASVLTISTDKSSGQNGDKINLTVKVNTAPGKVDAVLMTLVSTLNGHSHYMPVLIGAY